MGTGSIPLSRLRGRGMEETTRLDFEDLTAADKRSVNEACERFEAALRACRPGPPEEILSSFESHLRPVLLRELMLLECEYRQRRGEQVRPEVLAARFGESESAAATVVEQVRLYASPTRIERETGSPVVGPFRLGRELGRGGCGVVYLARDTRDGAEVALKLPLLPTLFLPELKRRFLREAQAAARLDHSGIVRVRDVDADGPVCFIASDYVPGPTLAGWMRSLSASGALPPFETVLDLTIGLAEAIAHAHERGVLHCDLKPANILLSVRQPGAGGQPEEDELAFSQTTSVTARITDFGLARLLYEVSDLSGSGKVLGTPLYMAPEQSTGGEALTERTDVWALGVILFEMLTGGPPFAGGTTLEVLFRVLHEDAAGPRARRAAVPAALDAVCRKCLEKDPARRYKSASELASDLRRWRSGQPVLARSPGFLARARTWGRRNPARAAMLFAGAISSAALTLGGWVAEGRVRDQRDLAVQAQGVIASERDRARELAGELERAVADIRVAQVHRALSNLEAGQTAMARECLDVVPPGQEGWEWWYLRRACQGGVYTLLGHTSTVTTVAVSHDGRQIASGDKDAVVRTWETRSGRPLAEFHASSGVERLLYAHDGVGLAVGDRSGAVEIWDAATGRPRVRTAGHKGRVTGLAFDLASTVLASCGSDGIRLWSASTGRLVHYLNGHTGSVNDVAFTPGGLLVSGGDDGTVRLWDVRTGLEQRRWSLSAVAPKVVCVAASPDGTHLIAGGYGGEQLYVWSPNDPNSALPTTLLSADLPHGMNHLTVSPDGAYVATSGHSVITVRELATGNVVRRLAGHMVVSSTLAFTPDGRGLVSGGYDRTVRLWDIRDEPTPRLCFRLGGPTRALAFSPNGRHLVGVTSGRVSIWDTITGRPLPDLPVDTHAVSFQPDGGRIATFGEKGTARLWDFPSGRPGPELRGHAGCVTAVTFSPDGRILATAGDDCFVRLWNTSDGTPLRSLGPFPVRVFGIAFVGDGSRLVVGFGDDASIISLVDTAGGRPVWSTGKFRGSGSRIMAFSPDGRQLAVQLRDDLGTVHVLDVLTGNELRDLQGTSYSEAGVVWLPDGRRAASGGTDGKVRIWDLARRVPVLELSAHTGSVNGVAAGPGDRLATAGADGMLCVWDADPDLPVIDLQGHTGEVLCAAFSPDGRYFATGGRDRTIRIWDASTGRVQSKLTGHAAEVVRLAFDVDRPRLTTFDSRGDVCNWDLQTGALLSTTQRETAVPESAGLPTGSAARIASPDGRTVAYLCKEAVFLVRPPNDREWARRRCLTRPNPEWHEHQALRFAAENRTFAADFHRKAARQAEGVLLQENQTDPGTGLPH
jgi:eukaryotic-like serine/threonine-protein kinase